MEDHLLIGVLIGMASGIGALIVISALTLRRFDVARRIEATRVHRALADLQRASERTERAVRQDIAATRRELETATRDSRDESAHAARALRDEITGGLRGVNDTFVRGLEDLARLQKGQTEVLAQHVSQLTEAALGALRDHPLPALSELAEAQERQLGALASELKTLAETVDARLEGVRSLFDERLRQIQADNRDSLELLRADTMGHAKDLGNDMREALRAHTDAAGAGMAALAESHGRQLDEIRTDNTRQIEQVRAAVEEKLEITLERRLGENFRLVGERLALVSERLEQVHRGLGEVQTFAAGLGNIQRALANVRLGATKARGEQPAADAGRGPRALRRKAKRSTDAAGDIAEAPTAPTEQDADAVRAQQ